ncbi:hypothetical protein FKG94_01625 [Exilibacterium tricleocarpae]|uniref:DUF3619 family protein n=1 Tax=Exilibacterium tricleocarpae TaxID=2591008 RepID=A0A545U9X4_9GAMM|nr:DUF3619 family protein [Exilibacterium tricleocarpae]TQV86277.1 hypothetical protein FKG94_01625 [Exilibacterium tricleocarpae]
MTVKQREQLADPWLDRARQQLDAEADRIDSATNSHLEQARRAALAQRDRPRQRFTAATWWRGGLAAAAVGVLAVALWQPDSSDAGPTTILSEDGFADGLLEDQAEPEFFDELEFYHWLSGEGIDTASGDENHGA